MSIESSDAIQPSHPLSSPPPPAFSLSQHQGLFKWVSSSHQVAKYWSFSFSISPSSEYSGLISFRIDWLDLLAVQGILKSLLQHHSSKASVLWHSVFFIRSDQSLSRVQLFATPWTAARQTSPSITNPRSSLKLMSIESSDAIQLSHPLSSLSSCLQSFPASGAFPRSQFFTSGGQRIGVSASASVLPMNIQDWFPLGWTSWISLQSKGLSRVFSNTTVQKHQSFSTQLSL